MLWHHCRCGVERDWQLSNPALCSSLGSQVVQMPHGKKCLANWRPSERDSNPQPQSSANATTKTPVVYKLRWNNRKFANLGLCRKFFLLSGFPLLIGGAVGMDSVWPRDDERDVCGSPAKWATSESSPLVLKRLATRESRVFRKLPPFSAHSDTHDIPSMRSKITNNKHAYN